MFRLALIFALCVILTTASNSAFGQIVDSTIWFKAPSNSFYEAGDLNALKGDFTPFALPDLRQRAKLKPISRSEAQKIRVPVPAKVISDDIILFRAKKCYRFRSKKGKLIWFDQNRDGKIQPLKEVRSIDSNGNSNKVYVEEVSCK